MLKTEHEKKAFLETLIVMAIMVALMFITGLKYLDPPPPGNIAVNFGYTDTGSGKTAPQSPQPEKKLKSEIKTPQPQISKPVKQEQVLTDNSQNSPVIPQGEKKKPKKTEEKPAKPKPEPKPKPSKEASDVLNNIFNAPEGNRTSEGEGDDTRSPGDKGNPNGSAGANNYYGTGGSGGGDPNYQLGGRRALSKPKPSYKCNEEGRVVVIIKVDRAGNVKEAFKGRGTTASKCLTDAAIAAAYKTKWEPAPNGEEVQIGKIIFNFKLSE
jgi:outer membrane biosynthesis protein TonB